MEQTAGKISQVIGELSQPGVDRAICVQVIRTFAQMVIREVEGLVALSHLAEKMILSPPLLPSPSAPGEAVERIDPVGNESRARRTSDEGQPGADSLQTWRDLSAPEFLSRLKAWMEEADVSQDELCRALDYKPVYLTRIMRGTDPLTGRFRERLLAYVVSRGNGQAE
jgi:hypothetical protein